MAQAAETQRDKFPLSVLRQPRRRAAMTQAQRDKLSIVQRAYVDNDPRWRDHRRKLAAAQDTKRMTLFDNEAAAMRKKGRNFTPDGAWGHRV
jgi:hypothetical protein